MHVPQIAYHINVFSFYRYMLESITLGRGNESWCICQWTEQSVAVKVKQKKCSRSCNFWFYLTFKMIAMIHIARFVIMHEGMYKYYILSCSLRVFEQFQKTRRYLLQLSPSVLPCLWLSIDVYCEAKVLVLCPHHDFLRCFLILWAAASGIFGFALCDLYTMFSDVQYLLIVHNDDRFHAILLYLLLLESRVFLAIYDLRYTSFFCMDCKRVLMHLPTTGDYLIYLPE